MKIKNLNFQTWCNNHNEKHDAKWCREVYPWIVFKEINFDNKFINTIQKIQFNNIEYEVTLLSIELQENLRFIGTFKFKSVVKSSSFDWDYRRWDTIFQLVFTQEGEFITVFTKKKDPSKELVSTFMKANFSRINEIKSRPLSELLFKSLISYIVELNFPQAIYLKKFSVGAQPDELNKQFRIKSKNIYPMFSIDRKYWILSCFNEEKAHRLGISMSDQCEKLTVVYCNPTYSRHHRCKHPNVEVISLFDFFNKVSPAIRVQFEKQILFLQNHLNIQEYISNDKLLEEIEHPEYLEYKIKKSELLEALSIMKIPVKNKYDAFYFFAGMNLVNGWLSRKRRVPRLQVKEEKLFKDMYFFKTYIRERILESIIEDFDGIDFYIENQLCIVQLFDFQFSFQHLPIESIITEIISSSHYKYIEWQGIRLQPKAPLIFSLARNIKRQYYEKQFQEGSNFS